MAGTNPLEHVVQHPIVETELDAGLLTPEGVVTLFSDHIAMTILAGLLLCILLPFAFRRSRKSGEGVDRLMTTGFAGVIEVICQYLRKEVAEPTLGEHTDRFIKYVWSLFFFVLAMNLLGMIPIGAITPLAIGLHIGGTATGNIWVTGTLAVVTLAMVVINGLRLGKVDFLKHFCPGPWWMAPILVPVEIAGWLAKTFALAVRLFANMLAGHLVLAVLLGFILSAGSVSAGAGFGVAIPVILGSVGISLLEIFVAFLQAFIFTFLTTLFIGMSVVFHHDDHEEATAH
ncbi:MAG: F0F1 ATP synthase subunit A [bacterium]|nr:F0F1 ATP synthase subunit A [bacterium]